MGEHFSVKHEKRRLIDLANGVLERYSGTEWIAALGDEALGKLPAGVKIRFDAVRARNDRAGLEEFLGCGLPRLEVDAARAMLTALGKRERVVGKESFEEIIDFVGDSWVKGHGGFPSHQKAYKLFGPEAREYARYLWGLNEPDGSMVVSLTGQRAFIERYLWIVNKQGKKVRFRYNELQEAEDEDLQPILNQRPESGLLEDQLKARQMGASKKHLATDGVCYPLSHPHSDVAIVCDEKSNLNKFRRIIENYYSDLPFQPARESAGSIGMGIFFSASGLGSSISFFSAGDDEIGTSRTFQLIFCSESAKFPGSDQKIINNMNSLNQAYAPAPHCIKRHETTGQEGWYKIRYEKLMERQDDVNEARAFFYGWFINMAEYSRRPPNGWIPDRVTEEYFHDHPEIFEYLRKKDRVDKLFYLMYWMQLTLHDRCEDDLGQFKKEYPANWREAFQANTEQFYSFQITDRLRKTCEFPKFAGDMHFKSSAAARAANELFMPGDIELVPSGRVDYRVPVKIWRDCDPTHTYIIAGDAASGVATYQAEDADFGAATVFDQQLEMFVAHFHQICTPEDLAYAMMMLSILYRGRSLPWVIAATGGEYGGQLVKELNQPANIQSCGYQLWQRESAVDSFGRVQHIIGFDEKGHTRMQIYDELRKWARQKLEHPPSEWGMLDGDIVHEMTKFTRISGKYQAAHKEHDDLLTTPGLCLIAHASTQTPKTIMRTIRPEKKEGPLSHLHKIRRGHPEGARDNQIHSPFPKFPRIP